MIFTEKEERDEKTHFYPKIPASGAGGGKLTLDKDNVHLSIAGNTNISNAEMKSPARITTETFDININTLLISLDKPSDKDILIDATIGKLELEKKANLILGANVNQLIVGKNAENPKIQIKSGSIVEQLTANAKVTLTGAGKINQLNVAASGVMLDSSLSVKKTVTATGVKAPTITGGSSGGGGGTASTPKIAINGLKNPIGEIQVNVGDLKDETEAKKSLPSMVTLLVDNKEIKDVTAKIGDWKIKNGTFDGNTAGSYTFVGAVKIPDGYAYSNGTLTAKATITVVANNATKKQLTTDTIVQYERIESYTEIDKEIKEALPTEVLLKCEDGSLIVGTIKNKDSWNRFGSPSSSSGEMSGYMEYPFHCDCANITLPAGYVFSQSSTITAHVYVKNRDNRKLQTALNAAWVQLDRTINSEAEALANPDKIYLLPTNDDERNVSQGVKYVQESVAGALKKLLTDGEHSIKNADSYNPGADNRNQKTIDTFADQITTAAKKLETDLGNAKTGDAFTDENILANIRTWLGTGNSNYAYSDSKQPWTPEKYNAIGSTNGIALPWEATWIKINDTGDTASSLYGACKIMPVQNYYGRIPAETRDNIYG